MNAPIDVNDPDTAKAVGAELATTTQHLTDLMSVTEVTDLASLDQAVRDRQAIGQASKRVEEFFKPLKQMANQLHKALCARESELLGPLVRLDREKAQAMSGFKTELDRLRREQERIVAEERRREQAAQAAAEAEALERAGEHDLAAAIVEESISALPPVVVLPDLTKQVEGLKFTRRWRWRYARNDKAYAMGLIPRTFLDVDEAKLGAYARSMKESAQGIPGVDFYYEDIPIR